MRHAVSASPPGYLTPRGGRSCTCLPGNDVRARHRGAGVVPHGKSHAVWLSSRPPPPPKGSVFTLQHTTPLCKGNAACWDAGGLGTRVHTCVCTCLCRGEHGSVCRDRALLLHHCFSTRLGTCSPLGAMRCLQVKLELFSMQQEGQKIVRMGLEGSGEEQSPCLAVCPVRLSSLHFYIPSSSCHPALPLPPYTYTPFILSKLLKM